MDAEIRFLCMNTLFRDRRHAGQILARQLPAYYRQPYCLVLGLARGGVPVAYEIAMALDLPLDAFVVCPLGVPGDETQSLGAITSGGLRVLDEKTLSHLRDADQILNEVTRREQAELLRRESLYRGGRAFRSLRHHTVILADDGLATGATIRTALHALRQAEVDRCVVALPVSPPEIHHAFEAEADDIICARTTVDFASVGPYYEDSSLTTDEEVREFLEASAQRRTLR